MTDQPVTNQPIPTKRLAISKTNARMVGVVAAAAFVTIFCLVAAKTIFSQSRYLARVITAKELAHSQLQKNITTYNQLSTAYQGFDNAATNVIGGSRAGTGDNDGSNSKIILDALPDRYDFPALASSIEKILDDNSLKVSSITGTDDQLNQQSNTSSDNPQPVEMPFSFTVTGASYASVGQLLQRLQQSIRPIQLDTLDISGGQNNMTVTVTAHTYFQPAKDVSITKKVVK